MGEASVLNFHLADVKCAIDVTVLAFMCFLGGFVIFFAARKLFNK